jgi:predicted Zn-dependent peptidase
VAASVSLTQLNRALGLAVAVIVASGDASSIEPPSADAQTLLQRTVLENGLTVVTTQRPDAETIAITLAVRAGSRFETDGTASAAKFLEHMYLQGTAARPSRDAIMQTVTSRGGTIGVATGWEFLDFSVLMAPEDFDIALDLLNDLLQNSQFEPDRIEHQRGLILRELAERRDNPSTQAFDLFYSTLFRDHQLRFLPSGLPAGVERLDRDTLLHYRDARVVASNIVMGVVTPFTHDDVLARLRSNLATLPTRPAPSVAGDPPPKALAQNVGLASGRNQATVIVGAPAPGLNHPDRYPLWLLQTILGPGGGRLFYDIRDAHGMAYDTSMRLALTAEAGSIMAYAGTDPSNVAEVSRLLYEHLARVRDELVSEDERSNAIGYLVGGTTVGLESGAAQAGQLAHNTALGIPIGTAELRASLQSVTREDIQRVARQYLAADRLTKVVVEPARWRGSACGRRGLSWQQ